MTVRPHRPDHVLAYPSCPRRATHPHWDPVRRRLADGGALHHREPKGLPHQSQPKCWLRETKRPPNPAAPQTLALRAMPSPSPRIPFVRRLPPLSRTDATGAGGVPEPLPLPLAAARRCTRYHQTRMASALKLLPPFTTPQARSFKPKASLTTLTCNVLSPLRAFLLFLASSVLSFACLRSSLLPSSPSLSSPRLSPLSLLFSLLLPSLPPRFALPCADVTRVCEPPWGGLG